MPVNQSLVAVGAECGYGNPQAIQSPGVMCTEGMGGLRWTKMRNTTFSSTLSSTSCHLPSSPRWEWTISRPPLAFGLAGGAKSLAVPKETT